MRFDRCATLVTDNLYKLDQIKAWIGSKKEDLDPVVSHILVTYEIFLSSITIKSKNLIQVSYFHQQIPIDILSREIRSSFRQTSTSSSRLPINRWKEHTGISAYLKTQFSWFNRHKLLDSDKERQTDRNRHRQTETERQTDKQTEHNLYGSNIPYSQKTI